MNVDDAAYLRGTRKVLSRCLLTRHPQGASVASSRQNDGDDLIAQFIFETHVTKNRV